MTTPSPALIELAAARLARPVSSDVARMAEHLRATRIGIAAIIAYGSCLRGTSTQDSLIDFFVLTREARDISAHALSRLAARLVPPNVYYAEAELDGVRLRCKYAVMTLDAFAMRMTERVPNPYFWARFAQPAALVFADGEETRDTIAEAVASAIATMYGVARATVPEESDPLRVWERGFAETYRTELRSESADRAAEIVAANAAFYRAAADALAGETRPEVSWAKRRAQGKILSILRLAKAAFTFQGGADYAAWKIERHSGRKITVSPWQRRHPILAGLMLLPSLLRRGAIR